MRHPTKGDITSNNTMEELRNSPRSRASHFSKFPVNVSTLCGIRRVVCGFQCQKRLMLSR